MSNLLHKMKDAVTGHHHGKESKNSSKRQQGASSDTGASGSNPTAEYPPGTDEYGGSGAGHEGQTEYRSQPTAGQYSSQAESYGSGRPGVGGSAPGGSSYATQPQSGQYTEGAQGYDAKVGSHMESDPRHVAGGTQQRSQW